MATKKAPVKKKSAVKSTKSTPKKKSSASKVPKYETLKLTKKDVPFFGTSLTKQTFYWTLLSVIVLVLGLWLINAIYDIATQVQIDSVDDTTPVVPAKILKK